MIRSLPKIRGAHQLATLLVSTAILAAPPLDAASDRPNILLLMADDWSYPHAAALGDPVVRTPTFDRMVREGALFDNAFVSSPSCTPSRHSVASGQYHWRLGEGADLGGSIAADVPVYPDLLAFDRRPNEELYDLRKDPDQMNNLAGDPAYRKIRDQLGESRRGGRRRGPAITSR